MTIPNIRYKSLTMLTAIAMACAGCHSDAPCPPIAEDPESLDPAKLTLCLNVSFDGQKFGTRAEDDAEDSDPNAPDGYEGPTGTFEKINTLRVIIVRNLSTQNGKLKGEVEANRMVMTNDEGRPMFDDLEFKVIANEDKRIYLIANEKFLTAPDGTGKVSDFLDSFRIKTDDASDPYTDLSQLSEWTVSVPGLTPDMTQISGYRGGLYSPSESSRLPLTEFFDLYVERKANDPNDTFYSHLFMTRAASKAIFYLNTSDNFSGDGIENTYIKAISLSGVGTTEYVFPKSTEYSPSKASLIQYTSEDLPASATKKEAYITTFETPSTNREITYLIDGLNEEIKKPADGKRKPIMSYPIYFPESILKPGEYYTVRVQLSNGTWLSAPLRPQMDGDNQINQHNILTIKDGDTERQAIARNTFLPIELNFNGAMDLTVNVLPWNREDYYVDFTANVGFGDEGFLNFTGTGGQTGDYMLLDKTAAQLVLNYGKVAHGSFYIASPVDARWDAYLITTGGATDAIQFQIPDPTDSSKNITTTHISGIVGRDQAEFGIVATVAPGDSQNNAQLMVIVTLANGTPVVANVIENWHASTDRLTIIENPK